MFKIAAAAEEIYDFFPFKVKSYPHYKKAVKIGSFETIITLFKCDKMKLIPNQLSQVIVVHINLSN